ncbi:MAG: hypothetical protein IAF02_18610 [Anaerolineae bacterium]|nr:hypothetical protein [Anaerolineae bacterium]
MTLQTNDSSPKVILQRIDTIISELQVLRQQVLTIQPLDTPSTNLVEELAGALGQGAWDEYDPDLDWKRFDT